MHPERIRGLCTSGNIPCSLHGSQRRKGLSQSLETTGVSTILASAAVPNLPHRVRGRLILNAAYQLVQLPSRGLCGKELLAASQAKDPPSRVLPLPSGAVESPKFVAYHVVWDFGASQALQPYFWHLGICGRLALAGGLEPALLGTLQRG